MIFVCLRDIILTMNKKVDYTAFFNVFNGFIKRDYDKGSPGGRKGT